MKLVRKRLEKIDFIIVETYKGTFCGGKMLDVALVQGSRACTTLDQ